MSDFVCPWCKEEGEMEPCTVCGWLPGRDSVADKLRTLLDAARAKLAEAEREREKLKVDLAKEATRAEKDRDLAGTIVAILRADLATARASLHKLQSEFEAVRAERDRMREALKSLDLPHRRAMYEGDGDPGCCSNCTRCRIDDVLAPAAPDALPPHLEAALRNPDVMLPGEVPGVAEATEDVRRFIYGEHNTQPATTVSATPAAPDAGTAPTEKEPK